MSVKKMSLWTAQKAFFEAGPQPTMFFGGVGSGKTHVMILKLLYLVDQYPGSRAVIVRQRFQQLKKTTAATLWKLLPANRVVRRNDNEGLIYLSNGSQILLLHLDKADSINNLKSLEINFAAVDQTEDISAGAWDTLWERLGRWSGATRRGGWPKNWPYRNRLGEPIPPRYLFGNCYSPGYDHWLTNRFWEHGVERERYAKRGYMVITGSTRENMALSEDYVADRLAMGEEYVRRFVDAVDWGAKEGRIFTIDQQSIVEPTAALLARIKRSMKLHRALDHGEFSPTACLWYATDNDGNVFFYREYMAADKLVSDHREALYQLSKDDFWEDRPNYYTNYADPSIFNKTRGRSVDSPPTWSVADEWSDTRLVNPRTAISWRRAGNDEAATVNRMREYLRVDPNHRNPITGVYGAPRVYFLRRTDTYPHGIYETIVDIRSQVRKQVGTASDGAKLFGDERDDKIRDHCYDAAKYALIMRPSPGEGDQGPPPDPGTIRIEDYFKLMAREEGREVVEDRRNFRGHNPIGW